jgi:toxin ParE1/3/4
MRLEWSHYARSDRDAIFDYIEAENPRAAVAIDNRIREAVETLLRYPERGRPGRIDGTRELVIGRTPYIAAYHIVGDVIGVLRLLHGAQLWPNEMLI